MWKFISRRDHGLMRRVHRWRAPRWIRLWMVCATRGGDGWLWFTLGLIILLYAGLDALAALAAAALATVSGIGLFVWLKQRTRRRRPCHIEPHCWANVLPPDHFSFPSGHSITAFAVALPIGLFFPPLMLAMLFCALSVAASRIVLGMHFLSDVVAGSAIGSMLGYAAFRLLS
ncbi:MAG: phosphatase PAP2 family protein [Bryobacterales bacterium]|nr:phosphatase PAP2 family protein [Bryobacterales bacterium]